MSELDKLRDRIDKVDAALVSDFEERMEYAKQVAEYKLEHNMRVLDRKREAEVLERAAQRLKDKSLAPDVAGLMNLVMQSSKELQQRAMLDYKKQQQAVDEPPIIAFQGEQGANSEAALKYYFGPQANTLACATFEDVFSVVQYYKASYGVVPIENSSTGSIPQVYDLLNQYELFIAGEQEMLIEHNLMGLSDAEIGDIVDVYSHEQALMQCSEFLKEYSFVLHPFFNTAGSAKFVAEEGDKKNAAIASNYAAQIYKLKILAPDVSTRQDNTTRFIVISANEYIDSDADKASVVFVLEHKTGALSEVLNVFAANGMNMVKIESRPLEDRKFEYAFHVDFEGPGIRESINRVVGANQTLFANFRLLGTYKKREQIAL